MTQGQMNVLFRYFGINFDRTSFSASPFPIDAMHILQKAPLLLFLTPIVAVCVCLTSYRLLCLWSTRHAMPVANGHISSPFNSSLGFGKIYYISLPEYTLTFSADL
jgi:hypothetical protein